MNPRSFSKITQWGAKNDEGGKLAWVPRGKMGRSRCLNRGRPGSWLIEKGRQSYPALLKPMSTSTFRLQSRYVLLTYSQCGELDPWSVHDTIASYPAECLVGRENHADGGIHLHAFVDFGRRINLRDPRRFDVGGHHPNVQPCGRTPQKMLDYAIKDGDVVAGGLNPNLGTEVSGPDNIWARIAAAGSVEEFWGLARELAPRALVCNHQSLRAYAEWHYRPAKVEYVHPDGLHLSTRRFPALDEWVRDNMSSSGEYSRRLRGSPPRGPHPPPSARARRVLECHYLLYNGHGQGGQTPPPLVPRGGPPPPGERMLIICRRTSSKPDFMGRD